MKKQKFIVVGGGTAGIIAASYLKTYWGDNIDIDLIYDHSRPSIGVGESLTPLIHNYLKYVGVSIEDLIKNVNATIKIGIQFENWNNDGKKFIHGFNESNVPYSTYNFGTAYEIVNGIYDHDFTYGEYWYDNALIPTEDLDLLSLHIDGVLFSRYIEDRFRDRLNIIDDVVEEVVTDNGEKINHLVLKNRGKVSADFYIDATGFPATLFKNLKNEWLDKSDWLPVNSCIPNPIPCEFTNKLPNHTKATATDQGWIFQVPLSHRWGSGYIWCDEYLSDDEAFSNFESFLIKNYGTKLNNTSRVLKFKSGHWKKQWVGNCIAVGLSSGFAEPLEATNIHHTVAQSIQFTENYTDKIIEWDVNLYNEAMLDLYENIYLYLRFCYTTGRTDSEFWRYMTNNTPPIVAALDEKVSNSILMEKAFHKQSRIFSHGNFTKVAYGQGKINTERYKNELIKRSAMMLGKEESDRFREIKDFNKRNKAIDHLSFIKRLTN